MRDPASEPTPAGLQRLLLRLEPEQSHALAMAGLRLAGAFPGAAALLARRYRVDDRRLAQTLLGRELPNPVGLAAGFDKDALGLSGWPALGFGFVEVGTVTPLAQAGNPKPRLFRHPAAYSLQNAMGFNNAGMAALAAKLAAQEPPRPIPVGVNLGKNRATSPERALADYETLLRGLGPLADYLVINLSSPNTPGLRDLQNETFLREVLATAKATTDRPVLVKLSPDLETAYAVSLAEAAVDAGAAGIVATNTTTDYSLLPGAQRSGPLSGGLSGRVLRDKSLALLRALAPSLHRRAVLVSVGGIDSGEEAYRRLRAGASLVQVYTGLVYRGPSLPRQINEEILRRLDRDGFASVAEAVGADLRVVR